MQKWEYNAEEFNTAFNGSGWLTDKKLNELGQDGWELISVDNGVAYFKRPIQPDIQYHPEHGLVAYQEETIRRYKR